ncbi:MAG: signal peptidase II [Myxococcota bacterium]
MPLRSLRWTALTLALVVVVLDLWSKQWAIDSLASFDHPMVLRVTDGATVAAALQARGLTAKEADEAFARGQVGRFLPARDLKLDRVLTVDDVDTRVLVTGGIGLPAPRQVQFTTQQVGQSVSQVLSKDFRLEPTRLQPLLDGQLLYRSAGRVSDPQEALAADGLVALSDHNLPIFAGFTFVYAENRGAAWGFLSSAPPTVRFLLFAFISLVASLVMIWVLWGGRMGTTWSSLALAAILGGAIGNLVDRLRFRIVVDFVLNYVVIDGKTHSWPVYNVADIGITVGVALIALELLVQRKPAPPVADRPEPG